MRIFLLRGSAIFILSVHLTFVSNIQSDTFFCISITKITYLHGFATDIEISCSICFICDVNLNFK